MQQIELPKGCVWLENKYYSGKPSSERNYRTDLKYSLQVGEIGRFVICWKWDFESCGPWQLLYADKYSCDAKKLNIDIGSILICWTDIEQNNSLMALKELAELEAAKIYKNIFGK